MNGKGSFIDVFLSKYIEISGWNCFEYYNLLLYMRRLIYFIYICILVCVFKSYFDNY